MLGSPLLPIVEERARTIMANVAKMRQLGVKPSSLLSCPTVSPPKKFKTKDSGSEYMPMHDVEEESDAIEGDMSCQSLSSEDNEL